MPGQAFRLPPSVTTMLPPPTPCDRRVPSGAVRPIRALLALVIALSPQAALACGAMVSESGQAEMLGFEAMLRWDGATEELLVSVDFQSKDPTFAWLMPLPAAPEIEEADLKPIERALEISEPPDLSGVVPELLPGQEESAPPAVGGAQIDVLGSTRIGGLRFVTLSGKHAQDVAKWMRKHGFAFVDTQEPVLQGYLDRGWIVVAARIASGAEGFVSGSVLPVRFTFPSPEPTYPLAMTGSSHLGLGLGMRLFVLSPFRPTSSTYKERIIEPEPDGHFALFNQGGLELRYSAPLGKEASKLEAAPQTWLTWYESSGMSVNRLTQDLVFARAADQTPIDYSDLRAELETQRNWIWVQRIAFPLGGALLGVWVGRRIRRSRRASEAARMPNPPPPSA